MKILHINHFDYSDYLNDAIFHGGRSLFGPHDYIESRPARYMYRGYPNKQALYGKGFTLYCRLEEPAQGFDQDQIRQWIADKVFDLIVYGSVFRNLEHWDLVQRVYPKERIIFIDGEDITGIRADAYGRGLYFKRELITDSMPDLYPISFGIPKDLIVDPGPKTKEFAHIDPADTSTYIHETEETYYRDYQSSYFGWTQKKAGWDCLRHYEILMNGCFPAIREVETIPPLTMSGFPKDIIRGYFQKYGYTVTDEYYDSLHLMIERFRQECTTEALWQRILRYVN